MMEDNLEMTKDDLEVMEDNLEIIEDNLLLLGSITNMYKYAFIHPGQTSQ